MDKGYTTIPGVLQGSPSKTPEREQPQLSVVFSDMIAALENLDKEIEALSEHCSPLLGPNLPETTPPMAVEESTSSSQYVQQVNSFVARIKRATNRLDELYRRMQV